MTQKIYGTFFAVSNRGTEQRGGPKAKYAPKIMLSKGNNNDNMRKREL